MKIRSPLLFKCIGIIGAILIRVWIGTLSFRCRPLRGDLVPKPHSSLSGRYIYVFWHENILVPCYEFGSRNVLVLISEHSDGEVIAQICQRLGYGTIRGSSTRGGVKALREMIRAASMSHIAVMPDGPRGPRRQLQLGLLYLAARTGIPIVLVGIGHDRPWRLNSWDQFVIPRPFSKAVLTTHDAITIPDGANREQLEIYRADLEMKLTALSDYAEHLAMR